MLLVKPIVLIFAIVNVTLLTQFSQLRSYPSLGNSFDVDRIFTINLIHIPADLNIDRLNLSSEYFSDRSSRKKLPINQVKNHMKIEFRQAGGYAGLRLGCDLDTNLLSAAESTQLESLVKTSGILQAKSERSENTADLISYEITIETQAGTSQVRFDDLTLPDRILPLLDYLQDRAKPLQ